MFTQRYFRLGGIKLIKPKAKKQRQEPTYGFRVAKTVGIALR